MHGKSPWKTKSKREVLLFFMIAYNTIDHSWIYSDTKEMKLLYTYSILCSIKLNSILEQIKIKMLQSRIENIEYW